MTCDNNVYLIKYIILALKYCIPLIIVTLGLINLLSRKNKKRALKKLLLCLVISLVITILTIIAEIILKNQDQCIKCTMENACKKQTLEQMSEKTSEQIEDQPEESQPIIETIDGVTYVDGLLIVNKTYSLPEDYMPVGAEGYQRCNECITEETKEAFSAMQADAWSLGLNLYISSGYRSYTYQDGLYNRYVEKDGKEAADKYSARAGYSEHQTGLAFDLNTIDDSFAETAEGKWIKDNCYRYGLILRYPKGKEAQTGYQYESWHLRYVGKELAEKLYNNGNWITLEEYYNLSSEYAE